MSLKYNPMLKYVKPPHSTIDTYDAETGMFQAYWVSTIAAVALALDIARSSATMVLTKLDKQVCVTH